MVLVVTDYLSKRWALALTHDTSFLGIFTIHLSHFNNDVVGMEGKNFILRLIQYATFLGPLLLLYFFFSFQFLNLERIQNINVFLSIWVAGVVGNIIDRVVYGTVINFFQIRFLPWYWNLSTLMIIVGCTGFFLQIYRYRKHLIFSNKRKLRLIHAGLQYDYVGKFLFVSLFLCMTISIFSYMFLKFYLSQYGVILTDKILNLYLIQMTVISILYLFIILMIGFHFSSRYVGPLYAFEKFIEKLENGDMEATLHLRENDYHQNLEKLATTIKNHWKV